MKTLFLRLSVVSSSEGTRRRPVLVPGGFARCRAREAEAEAPAESASAGASWFTDSRLPCALGDGEAEGAPERRSLCLKGTNPCTRAPPASPESTPTPPPPHAIVWRDGEDTSTVGPRVTSL